MFFFSHYSITSKNSLMLKIDVMKFICNEYE